MRFATHKRFSCQHLHFQLFVSATSMVSFVILQPCKMAGFIYQKFKIVLRRTSLVYKSQQTSLKMLSSFGVPKPLFLQTHWSYTPPFWHSHDGGTKHRQTRGKIVQHYRWSTNKVSTNQRQSRHKFLRSNCWYRPIFARHFAMASKYFKHFLRWIFDNNLALIGIANKNAPP